LPKGYAGRGGHFSCGPEVLTYLPGWPGLAGFFGASLGELLAPPLGVGALVPPEPDGLALPEAEVPPPEAGRLPSRSHPAKRAPLSANATAAANAVSFIVTSMGLCDLTGSN
jgi:hypothetical protein